MFIHAVFILCFCLNNSLCFRIIASNADYCIICVDIDHSCGGASINSEYFAILFRSEALTNNTDKSTAMRL